MPSPAPRRPTRRQAREWALQILYQIDVSGTAPDRALALFGRCFASADAVHGFTADLVTGTRRDRRALDRLIADAAEHWRLGRLPKVDLNLLRLAAYELSAYPELSAGVTINEAIEIARRYCSDDAPTFVNGVLDRIAAVVGKKGGSAESEAGEEEGEPHEPGAA